MKDYTLGTIEHFGPWPNLRVRLGCLFSGILTPSCLSAGDDGWVISVRSRRKLSKAETDWLMGWFEGAKR